MPDGPEEIRTPTTVEAGKAAVKAEREEQERADEAAEEEARRINELARRDPTRPM